MDCRVHGVTKSWTQLSDFHFQGGSVVKNLPAKVGDATCLIFGLGRFSGGRKWQSIPVFLPAKPHGQRSLVDFSPWGCKESDTKGYTH